MQRTSRPVHTWAPTHAQSAPTGQSNGEDRPLACARWARREGVEGAQRPMYAQMDAGGTDWRAMAITMLTSRGISCGARRRWGWADMCACWVGEC